MDKISTIRTLALLDDNKRAILDMLEVERTYDEIKSKFPEISKTQVQGHIDQLKKIGLVRDSSKFLKIRDKDVYEKKFVRTF